MSKLLLSSSAITPGETALIILLFILIIFALIVILNFVVRGVYAVIDKHRKKAVPQVQNDELNETAVKTTEEKPEEESFGDRIVGGLFAFIIKLLLIAVIVFFGLVNYKLFSFKGFAKTETDDNMSLTEVVLTLTSISKVEYYDKAPIPFSSESYNIYIETRQENYIFSGNQDDIDALNALSILSDIKPQKITPVPYYVEIIFGIIVLIIPLGGRRRH